MAEERAVYTLSAAVLGGAALVALTVWQGFRRISADLSRNGEPLAAEEQAERGKAPATPATPAAPPVPVADSASQARDAANRVIENAQDALTRQQPAYVEPCWKRIPRAPEVRDPGGTFEVELAFGADGVETRRAFHSITGSPALVACVKGLPVKKLSIPPPGVPTTVKVSMAVP